MNGQLVVERRGQVDRTVRFAGGAELTPMVGPDYWCWRVRLTETQAVVAFPKFSTIGIGFQQEEDWNTNLPHTSYADEIADHIFHNAGDPTITKEAVSRAIQLIREDIVRCALAEVAR